MSLTHNTDHDILRCVISNYYPFIQLACVITREIESCYFEPPDGATLETLDKHWQNY